MGVLEAIILGIVQGLTEFLPVSSSGHIELMKAVQGQDLSEESSMLMVVVLHFATAASTMVIFRKEVAELFKGLFQFKVNESFLFSVKIVLSMIPAAAVGVLWEDYIESFFDGRVALVGCMLIVTGLLLFFADRAKTTVKDVGMFDAVVIGISQAIAIIPGISRSGATIGTSVLLGVDREKAARFSFLMVVPLIFGKMFMMLMKDGFTTGDITIPVLSAGFIAAFFTGIIACKWMIALVKKSNLRYFSVYCFVVGLIAIGWILR